MKKNLKRIVSAILTISMFVMLLPLCGCPVEETTPNHIAILYSARSKNGNPPFGSDNLNETFIESCTSYGSAAIITVDGCPRAVFDRSFPKSEKNLSENKKKQIAEKQLGQIYEALVSSVAESEESDLLCSITLAARVLASKNSDEEKNLIIIDNGLSTTGYMNFAQQNLLMADNSTVISWLKSKEALPDLSNVKIIWYGLGDVGDDQETLTPSNLKKLRSLWRDVLCESGCMGEPVFATDLPGVGIVKDRSKLPYVSPVMVFSDDDKEFDIDKITILKEDYIGFKPDTADFVDEEATREYLAPIARELIRNPSTSILLAGTTATAGSNEGCKKLSLLRARAVAKMLSNMGVSEYQMETVGLGYKHDFHVPDTNDDGSLNSNAQANRSVILIGQSEPEKAEYARSIGLT